jgi:alkylation response protein AidB-like acyl-CoA dehydrogenase
VADACALAASLLAAMVAGFCITDLSTRERTSTAVTPATIAVLEVARLQRNGRVVVIIAAAGSAGGLRGRVGQGEKTVDALNLFYNSRPATIYGGSNEIQRNILAKAVLELPDA